MRLALELRHRAFEADHRLGSGVFHIAAGGLVQAYELRFSRAHLGDVFGVAGMVGGYVQNPAALQAAGDQGHRRRLQQPALVVASLRPGVREEDSHAS